MKKLKLPILVFTLCSFVISSKAQTANAITSKTTEPKTHSSVDWLGMMRDPNVNIHDVQKAFYKWYKIHHKEDKDKVATKGGEEDDGAYSFFKRWEWYNLPRANKDGSRPNLYKIASDYKSYLDNNATHTHRAMHNSTPSTGTWTYKGNTAVPGNSNSGNGGDGRVNRVRLMPGNTATMFACTASGGLWESTNSGTSWSTVTDQLGDLTTSDIAINPLKTKVMYLATGDGDGIQSIYPDPGTIGVLKSYDGGATWSATSLAYTMSTAGANLYAISELLIDPTDTSVLVAATSFGIWRSANSGSTWTMEQSGWFHSIEFDPANADTIYAGASSIFNNAAFYRSINNGVSWTQITSGLPSGTNAEGFEIGVSKANSNYVYVLADATADNSFYGLYLSTNHGTSFSTQSTTPDILGWDPAGAADGGQGWYTLSLAISPTNVDSVFVGGVNIWSSSNKGVAWTLNTNWEDASTSSSYVHADIHNILPIPGTSSKGYIVGCDGGIFKTSTNSTKWTDISNNLEIAQQYCVAASTLTAGKWLTGWQDNGTYINTSTPTVNQAMGGDGMDCFISWASDNDMYAENGNGSLNNSTDGGTNWNSCVTGVTENGPWVTPWVQDPKTSTTFYSGFSNVWKSTGSVTPSWTKISTWGGTGSITAIAVDSANPSYIYAAQSNIIELTKNGGTSWTNITGSLPVSSTSISGIALSSKTPSHVWVTMNGYSSGNQVFYSTNSGTTWTNISTGLPNLPVNCIVYESGSPNAVYVGTDQGVYYKDTTLTSWLFYNTGLPMVMVGGLTIYKPGKILIAATYGRGTWESPLYTTALPAAGFKVSDTSVCVGNAITFTDTSTNGPTTWAWTFAGGTPATATTQTVSVVYATAGVYSVTLKATNGAGSNTVTRTSYISAFANPSVATSATTDVTCLGGSNGSASSSPSGGATPYTYSWSGGGTGASKTGLTAGTYTITVTDKHGCTATATVSITQPATGISAAASVATNLTCNGGNNASVTSSPTGGTSPYTYAWSGGGTNSTKTGLTAGTYTITITDNKGCSSTAKATVTDPAAIVISNYSIPATPGSCNGIAAATVISGGTAPYTYLWTPGGLTTDTIKSQCINTYCCLITDKNGCKDSSCVDITTTGIDNISDASNISIYPDPNNGSFTVAGVIQGQIIEVYNNLGQNLSSAKADKTTMYFDISTKADGIYLVRILNKDGSVVTQKKIIKAQ